MELRSRRNKLNERDRNENKQKKNNCNDKILILEILIYVILK